MPRPAYSERLSNLEIIELFQQGRYLIDLQTGVITSKRTGKALFTYEGNDEGHLFVRLYKQPKHRTLPVTHVVWMVATGESIPKGWEVHHEDRDVQNNNFENLYCLHPIDHRKIHRLNDIEEPIPF